MILHWAFGAYLAGLGTSNLVEFHGFEMSVLILVGVLAGIFFRKDNFGSFILVLCFFPLGLILGGISSSADGQELHKIYREYSAEDPLTVYGEVIATDLEIYSREAIILKCEVIESRGEYLTQSPRILVFLPDGEETPQLSDKIFFDCTLGEPDKYLNSAQLRKHRIDAWCFAQIGSLHPMGYTNPATYVFHNFKDRLLGNLSNGLSGDRLSLYQGVVFGKDAGSMSKNLKNEFYDSGISHLIVASGAQVALIILPLLVFFRRIRNSWMKILIFFVMGAAMILLYLIVGHASSILRAISVGFVLLLGKAINRRSNPLNSLCAVGLLWLIMNPANLNDAGFMLSYSASFGILYMAPIMVDWAERKFPGGLRPGAGRVPFYNRLYFSIKRHLVHLAIVTIASQWGVMPIIARFFGRISFNGIMANLIAVPIGSIVLVVGAISGVVGFIHPGISWVLNMVAGPFLSIMISIAGIFSQIDFLTVSNVKPPVVVVVAYYLVTIGVIETVKRSTSMLRAVSKLTPSDQ